ncbi:hypothetical protein BG011_002206 [Mortierella polycephala]|uniref:Ras-GAP domain-containing protein n=1 Tax=Mortierella polycephala TaxID=41804 RepID=A0A9P6U4A2_9FUNG|nr:hypothetical protein BG011_002206 [Mortierella polycephala]
MDQKTFNAWLYALKSYAKPETFGVSRWLEYRLYRTFWIMVNDGRRLPKDLEAYCEIMLDDQRRARTSTKAKMSKGSDTDTSFWRDSFEFTDLAAFSKGITINVIQARGSKLIPFGRTYIPLRNSQERDEGWYPIMHINNRTQTTEHLGDLRLKLQYEEQIILPIENYIDLLEIIVNFQENNVLSKLASRVSDLESFARNVLRILEGKSLAVAWINSLVDKEIAETSLSGVNTLFRANTLLTKALEAYMRLVGTEYLDDTFGDILRDICKNKVACEVDPCKLDKNDDIKRLTEKFSDRGPTGEVGPESESVSLVRYTGVSGFVFLRLICPAILGPRLFYIVREHPEARAHRTLTLIAKSLQGLANLVNFGAKELWMVPMNDFIIENTQSFKDFIDLICMAEGTSGIRSCSNSVHSLTMQPPHSPGSTHSAKLRAQTKNGCAAIPPPSPSFQTRSNARHISKEIKETVLSPVSDIDSATMERSEDMPLLPHLIDLGKELAHFTKTVARLIRPPPQGYEGEYEGQDYDRHDETDEDDLLDGEDSILRNLGRACWEIVATIDERVQLSLDLEHEERQRANDTPADGKYVKGKVSREGPRDGEESYVVYEHDDGNENDVESFDGCGRGYDSDDESLERRFAS